MLDQIARDQIGSLLSLSNEDVFHQHPNLTPRGWYNYEDTCSSYHDNNLCNKNFMSLVDTKISAHTSHETFLGRNL